MGLLSALAAIPCWDMGPAAAFGAGGAIGAAVVLTLVWRIGTMQRARRAGRRDNDNAS